MSYASPHIAHYFFSCHRYQDPFEEYKTRLAKKLAKRAEAEQTGATQNKAAKKQEGDDINWFGVKVGTPAPALASGTVGGGVGKYLNLKRPSDAIATGVGHVNVEDGKKKRKIGFGDFDGW